MATCSDGSVWELNSICRVVDVIGVPRTHSKNPFASAVPRTRTLHLQAVLLYPQLEVKVLLTAIARYAGAFLLFLAGKTGVEMEAGQADAGGAAIASLVGGALLLGFDLLIHRDKEKKTKDEAKAN